LNKNLIGGDVLQLILSASLISMLVAPFIIQYNGRITRRFVKSYLRNSGQKVEAIELIGNALTDHVIVCGYGRSGQYLGRFLKEESIPFIALDIDPTRVHEAGVAGEHVVYGDAGRRAVLHAAGAGRAKAKEVVPEVLEGSLMLASHALVLLDVPLNRVVKRIRKFREERYQMFKGFYHGVSDAEADSVATEQVRLHPVEVAANAFANNMRVDDIDLAKFKVEIKAVRRPNMLEDIEPRPDMILLDGDVLVLLGTPDGLVAAESYLVSGH